ncbi:hypothetical protein DL769_009942 [Monosporascus sp. CRB-8-3]|nr:hypothetical protein DL769_009942 [Monosporascus sp. CRB-8-3]
MGLYDRSAGTPAAAGKIRPTTPPKHVDPSESIISHVRVNRIADLYKIPKLVQLANSKIELSLQANWSSEIFVQAMREASPLEKGLQEIFAREAAKHVPELVARKDLGQVRNLNPFAVELLRVLGRCVRAGEGENDYKGSISWRFLPNLKGWNPPC